MNTLPTEQVLTLWSTTRMCLAEIAATIGCQPYEAKLALRLARQNFDPRAEPRDAFRPSRVGMGGPKRKPVNYQAYDDAREHRQYVRSSEAASAAFLASLAAQYGSPSNCPSLRNVVR